MIPLLLKSWVKEADIWAFLLCTLTLSSIEEGLILLMRLLTCQHDKLHVATQKLAENRYSTKASPASWNATGKEQTEELDFHA